MATCPRLLSVATLALVLHSVTGAVSVQTVCPNLGSIMDCGKRKLTDVPSGLPSWVQTLRLDSNSISHLPADAFGGLTDLEELILTNNRLKDLDTNAICRLPKLRVLKLSRNALTRIPDLRRCVSLEELYLNGNNISAVGGASALAGLRFLTLLDLSKNPLAQLNADIFPADSGIKYLNLADSGIESIDAAAFTALGSSLEKLRLGRNRLTALPPGVFARTRRIEELDLSRNRFRYIEYTTFKDMSNLRNLTLRRNEIEVLKDGSFFECKKLETLNLEENSLTELKVGSFFGLEALKELYLAGNNISAINAMVWEQTKVVTTLDLSRNNLQKLGKNAFSGLRMLKQLFLSRNGLQAIEDLALDGLEQLENLDLSGNRLSDSLQRPPRSVFSRLSYLTVLDLHSNTINSVSRRMFEGLSQLRQLSLRDNPITTVEQGAFNDLHQLIAFEMSSGKLVCDCKLVWLAAWLKAASYVSSVTGTCLEPSSVRGRNLYDLAEAEFACEANAQSLLPVLVRWPPMVVSALRYSSKTLSCEATASPASAAASEKSPLTMQWSKDGEIIKQGDKVQLQAEVYKSDRGMTRYVALLHLMNLTDSDEGRYQCDFANEFGLAFSPVVELKVLVYPQFSVIPASVITKAEQDVSLKCAAIGQPPPEISIQKDGGVNFPSARDRRFSFNQETNEFIIKKARAEDAGIYYCVARNDAGTNVANATVDVIEPPRFTSTGPECPRSVRGQSAVLTCPVDGSPRPRIVWHHDGVPIDATSDRHILSSLSSKLVIADVERADSGRYTCVASNPLGKVEATCVFEALDGPALSDYEAPAADLERPAAGPGQQLDSTTITGIIVISVVCCVVGTSLVWVIIIYHMRRQRLRHRNAINRHACDGSSSSSSGSGGARTEETLLPLPEVAVVRAPLMKSPRLYDNRYALCSSGMAPVTDRAVWQAGTQLVDRQQQLQLTAEGVTGCSPLRGDFVLPAHGCSESPGATCDRDEWSGSLGSAVSSVAASTQLATFQSQPAASCRLLAGGALAEEHRPSHFSTWTDRAYVSGCGRSEAPNKHDLRRALSEEACKGLLHNPNHYCEQHASEACADSQR